MKIEYNNPKAIWQSKTFMIALIQAVIAVVVVYSSAYPDVGVLLFVKSVLDIYIRHLTSQPIERN